MKASVAISVKRDNGVILQRSFVVEQERLWATRTQTRAEFRAKFERQLAAAVNSVLGS
jgi:hypothetical protein